MALAHPKLSYSLAVLCLLGAVGFAAPAHAATTITRNDANCTSGSFTTGAAGTGVQAGDILNITGNFASCNSMLLVPQSLVASAASVTGTMSSGAFPTATTLGSNWLFQATGGVTFASISITLAGTGGGSVQINTSSGPSNTSWVVSTSGGGSSSSRTTSATPSPLLQQFGKPASGTCAEAASDSLNWSGVASGGWSESWAQWMNDGQGGYVCNREIFFNASANNWDFR